MADIGNGTTIVFNTASDDDFLAELLTVTGPSQSRASIATSNMATTSDMTFMPDDLVDNGTIAITYAYDSNDVLTKDAPISEGAQTITITEPIPEGLTGGATLAFSGFVTDVDIERALGEKMIGSATIKISGAITRVDAT